MLWPLIVLIFVLTIYPTKENNEIENLYEAKCTVVNVELANTKLVSILKKITNKTFFRLIKIDLNRQNCPFLDFQNVQQKTCFATSFHGIKKNNCSLSIQNEETKDSEKCEHQFEANQFVNQSLTAEENKVQSEKNYCIDPDSDEYWLDLCNFIPTKHAKYINLQINLETFTNYNGSEIWKHIYSEIHRKFSCNDNQQRKQSSQYLEEQILHRLLSGIHTSVNIHNNIYYQPPQDGVCSKWSSNLFALNEYIKTDEWIKNLKFTFLVLFRAIHKADEVLRTYKYQITETNEKGSESTLRLVETFLNSKYIKDCLLLYDAFDETIFFYHKGSNNRILKENFKSVFHQISKLLDCIDCEKCKLHGKIQILGIGTALKILLLPQNLLKQSLARQEIIALFNTIYKVSTSISAYSIMKSTNINSSLLKNNQRIECCLNLNSKDNSVCLIERLYQKDKPQSNFVRLTRKTFDGFEKGKVWIVKYFKKLKNRKQIEL